MSPEQCRGEPLDRRSDIFSLGILMHEMTLCRRLFRGETDFQILKQIAEGPIPRPRELDASYDVRLQAIVMRALERDPARRFQTARELQQALEELAHDMRLRLSPLSLADYMQALFADKIGAWHEASADGDVAKLEKHLLTVMAEREANEASDEGEAVKLPPPPSLSGAELSSLPDEALGPVRRGRGPVVVMLSTMVAALAFAGWRYRGELMPPKAPPPPAPIAAPTARATELPTPVVQAEEPATAVMEVTTKPAGATLVLDGKTRRGAEPGAVDGGGGGAACARGADGEECGGGAEVHVGGGGRGGDGDRFDEEAAACGGEEGGGCACCARGFADAHAYADAYAYEDAYDRGGGGDVGDRDEPVVHGYRRRAGEGDDAVELEAQGGIARSCARESGIQDQTGAECGD